MFQWHLGFCRPGLLPTSRGFQHHTGFWGGSQDYYTHTSHRAYDFRSDRRVLRTRRYSTDIFRDRAVQIIRVGGEHRRKIYLLVLQGHDSTQPLLLYLPFQAPHEPLQVNVTDATFCVMGRLQVPAGFRSLYRRVRDRQRATYLGMVTALDAAVGRVVRTLRRAAMWDNTILVFLSDNGGGVHRSGSNWPLRGSKHSLFEGGTRVPAFITGPGLASRVENRGEQFWTE